MRLRLVLLVAATVSLVAIAFVVPLASVVAELAEERATRPAELATRSLAPALSLEDDATTSQVLDAIDPDGFLRLGVVAPSGAQMGSALPQGASLARLRTSPAGRYDGVGGVLVVVPVATSGGTSLVHALVPQGDLRRGVTAAWAALAGLSIALLAGSLALADRLARRTLTSVSTLERTAARLANGELDARAENVETAELAAVADALEVLALRIDELLRLEREAAADLSHRLRTPLTPLRIEVEALADSEARTRLVTQVGALERAVSEVIHLTRGRDSDLDAPTIVDLAAVVRDRAAFWSALTEDEGRLVDVDVPRRPCMVRLRPDEASDLVDVLLDNVLTHTPTGTDLRLAVSAEGGRVLLRCDDEGPGFAHPDDALRRGATWREGSTGLGLDIARRLATRGNGRISVSTAPTGGASVLVDLAQLPGT